MTTIEEHKLEPAPPEFTSLHFHSLPPHSMFDVRRPILNALPR